MSLNDEQEKFEARVEGLGTRLGDLNHSDNMRMTAERMGLENWGEDERESNWKKVREGNCAGEEAEEKKRRGRFYAGEGGESICWLRLLMTPLFCPAAWYVTT